MSQDFRDALSAQEIFSLQKSNFCILTIRSASWWQYFHLNENARDVKWKIRVKLLKERFHSREQQLCKFIGRTLLELAWNTDDAARRYITWKRSFRYYKYIIQPTAAALNIYPTLDVYQYVCVGNKVVVSAIWRNCDR